MIREILSNKFILLAARLVIGFVFLYAGIIKVNDPGSFADSVANYKILPDYLINIVAIIIPWIELISGLLIIFGVAVRENALVIINLLGIFIILIIVSVLRGLNIDCGCFGTQTGTSIGLNKIIEDLLLLVPAIQLLFLGGGSLSLSSFNEQKSPD